MKDKVLAFLARNGPSSIGEITSSLIPGDSAISRSYGVDWISRTIADLEKAGAVRYIDCQTCVRYQLTNGNS